MGSGLPSNGDLLIIRPTGKKGRTSHRSNRLPLLSRGPARKPGILKQDPNAMRSQAECSSGNKVKYTIPRKS